MPFQQTVTTPMKRINTRQADQPTCSKTLDMEISGGKPCIYARKRTPQAINHERSEDWLKKEDQPRNDKGHFMSPNKNTEKGVDLELSIVSEEEFDCYNKSDDLKVRTNIEDELQLLPKDNKLTPEQGMTKEENKIIEPTTSVSRSNRLPFEKQTEKLGGVPYNTNNIKKKLKNNGHLYRKRRQQQRWKRVKTKATVQYCHKIKKSVQYGYTTVGNKFPPDQSGAGM